MNLTEFQKQVIAIRGEISWHWTRLQPHLINCALAYGGLACGYLWFIIL